MREHIILFDFNSGNNFGASLRRTLTSVSSWDVQHHSVTLGDEEPTEFARHLTRLMKKCDPSLMFLVFPGSVPKQGRRLLKDLQTNSANPPLIIAVEAGEPDEMFTLLELGAADFITSPVTPLNILPRVRRLLELSRDRQTTVHALRGKLGLNQLIGESQVFSAVKKKISLVARCDANVLISGETGTGKELCARAIHYLSPRVNRAFVPVNCGAFPTELVENELFGHERGAFTSAFNARAGLVEEADGGTLFLDEIDSLSLAAQIKLLRFLQEREYRALGSAKTRRSDSRVIAAANVDFAEAVRAGSLRKDLYYRLNVIPLDLPPLRERREDIPLLARHFLDKYETEFNRPNLSFSGDALEQLSRYEWPGNVRELEHLIARSVALAEHGVIGCAELSMTPANLGDHPLSFREAKVRFERSYVEDLLIANGGNISRAAREAHKNRRAFWELIRKHKIDADRFRTRPKSNLASK